MEKVTLFWDLFTFPRIGGGDPQYRVDYVYLNNLFPA